MKYIKLFEDFNGPDANFSDMILNQICGQLRREGYHKAYFDEKETPFVYVDKDNILELEDSKVLPNHKQEYILKHKATGKEAKYVQDSKDVKEIVSVLVK